MKVLLILLFLLFSHYTYAGRFYSSEYGRWVNRDPIGVEGGISLYNSVSNDMVNGYSGGPKLTSGMLIINGLPVEYYGLDSYGNKVEVIDLPDSANDQSVKKSKESFDLAIAGLKKVKALVNKITSKGFKIIQSKEGSIIQWEGKDFKGTKEEYLKLINYELESTYTILDHKSSKRQVSAALIKLTNTKSPSLKVAGVTSKNYKVFILHGEPDGVSSFIGGSSVNRIDFFELIKPKQPFYLSSCYSNCMIQTELINFISRAPRYVDKNIENYYVARVDEVKKCFTIKAQSIIPFITIDANDPNDGLKSIDITNLKKIIVE